MDLSKTYQPARGFSFRKETFGGVLYHYEGLKPDPSVFFLESRFLVEMLEALCANPGTALGALIEGARAQFSLSPDELLTVETFFETLTQRGALVTE